MKNLLITFTFLSNLMGQIDFSNSIIIEKENKDSKTKKYIAYPIIAGAGICTALFMLLIIAFST